MRPNIGVEHDAEDRAAHMGTQGRAGGTARPPVIESDNPVIERHKDGRGAWIK